MRTPAATAPIARLAVPGATAPRRSAHRQALVSGGGREALLAGGQREGGGLEIGTCVLVARSRGGDVVGDHRLALARELLREHLLERLQLDAGEAQYRGD